MRYKKIKIKVSQYLSKHELLDIIVKNILVRLFQLKFKVGYNLQVDSNKILFECFKGKFVNDSPLSIYNELQINNLKYSFVWVLSNLSHPLKEYLESQPNTSVVIYGSKEYFRAYASAKYWFVNCRIPYRIVKKPEQVYIQCWHGTPLKKLGQDITIINYAKSSLSGLRFGYNHESMRLDYFISPSAYASRCFISSFNLEPQKILELGYPRNDKLSTHEKNNDEIERIKKALGISLKKKVILYAPTWRDNNFCNVRGVHVLSNPLDSKEFVASFPDVVFLYRGHYFTKPEEKMAEFIDVSAYNNINDLFLVSDALITDYSSLFFDYAILKRPIYFYMPDLDEYGKEIRGFYLDVEKELPGEICKTPKELSVTMNKKYENASIFVEFNKKYNTYEDGASASRVIKKIGLNSE